MQEQCLQTQEEIDAREHFWADLIRLGKSVEDQTGDDAEDLSEVPPHMLGRR